MTHFIRQFHRWMSVAFTLGVITYMVVMTKMAPAVPPGWVGLFAAIPLLSLFLSGCYMFVRPYLARRRPVDNV